MIFNLLKIRVYPLNCIQSCYGAAGVLDLEMIEMMMAMMMMSSRLKKKIKMQILHHTGWFAPQNYCRYTAERTCIDSKGAGPEPSMSAQI